MAKVTIYDMTGKSVGERELNDAIFAVTPNKAPKFPAAAKSPGARRGPVTPVRVRPARPSGLTAALRWAPSPAPTATPSTAR